MTDSRSNLQCAEKDMRVVHLTTSFPVSVDAISGTFVERLVTYLSSQLSQVVLTPAGCGSGGGIPDSGYELQEIRYAPNGWRTLAQQPGGIPAALSHNRLLFVLVPPLLLTLLAASFRYSQKADLFHGHWAICGAIVGVAGRLSGKPVVTTLRGSDVTRAQSNFIDRAILSLCIKLSHKLVCVSEAMAARLCAMYPESRTKFSVVPNGVENKFLQVNSEHRGPCSETVNLTTVASLVPAKGVGDLISAVAMLSDSKRISLTIVGDGPQRTELERLVAQHKLESLVQFIGNVSSDRVVSCLASTDIFVLASRSEGRPNVIVEAMAAGVAIIGTRIEGIMEILTDGETGMLYDSGSIEQLAACIERLSNSSLLRKQLGSAANRYVVEQRLTWEETASRYLELYAGLLAPRHDRRKLRQL